jgi:two-component system, NarL family, response regulator DegU
VQPPPVLRLLIADDHQLFAHALRDVLESNTVQVVGIATTGREAVELTLALTPDVLVLDLGLPDIDGFEALQLLREHRARTGTIVVSAQDAQASRARALELGALAFLSKGHELELDALRDAVAAAAALVRAARPALDDA